METLREWAAAICTAAVLCAVINMAAPEGKTVKALRMLLSAVMLCLLISPISKIEKCTDSIAEYIAAPSESNDKVLTLVEEQTLNAMNRSVCNLITDELASEGYYSGEIFVEMDISDDGCISIGQVLIEMDDIEANEAEKICDRIYERLGLAVQITGGEG